MIQIQRPDDEPSILKRLGAKQTRLDCIAYDACPADYNSSKVGFPNRKYYSDKEVKDLLARATHNKCCYCERKCWSYYELDVEHFRPRCGVRQTLDQKNDELPGYYWLAYDWKNLLLSCAECNRRFKKTFFPLANPTERARSHHDDVTRESPLFVDPVGQDPRDHIRFVDYLPTGITEQGRVTIDGLRLTRTNLTEDRLKKIDHLDLHLAILAGAARHPEDYELQTKAMKAREFIEAARQPDAEFSSMAIDYIAGFEL